MNFSIKAKLVDTNKKAVGNVEVRAYYFDHLNRAKQLAIGKTTTAGSVALNGAINTSVMPRFLLKYKPRGSSRLVNVTDQMSSIRIIGSIANVSFGTVEVHNQAVVTSVGISHYGVSPVLMSAKTFQPTSASAAVSKPVITKPLISQAALTALRNSEASLKASKINLEKQNKALNTDLSAKNLQIKQLNLKLTTLPTLQKDKARLSNDLKVVNRELLEVKNLNKALTLKNESLQQANKGSSKLETVVASVGSELTNAHKVMAHSGFKLGRVSMEMKVIPAANGTSLFLPKQEELSEKSGSLSTLYLDFDPPAKEGGAIDFAEVPEVVNASETAAKRKLQEHQLTSSVRYRAVNSEVEAGRVLSQSPEAGAEDIPIGSVVEITVGEQHPI